MPLEGDVILKQLPEGSEILNILATGYIDRIRDKGAEKEAVVAFERISNRIFTLDYLRKRGISPVKDTSVAIVRYRYRGEIKQDLVVSRGA